MCVNFVITFLWLINIIQGTIARLTSNARSELFGTCYITCPGMRPRTGSIEIQVRSNLDRGKILALYLVQRTNFWVSFTLKILFHYTKDTLGGSLDTEPVSSFWFADPNFEYRARPWVPPSVTILEIFPAVELWAEVRRYDSNRTWISLSGGNKPVDCCQFSGIFKKWPNPLLNGPKSVFSSLSWARFSGLGDIRHRTRHLEPGSEQRGASTCSRVNGDWKTYWKAYPGFSGEENAHWRRLREEVRADAAEVGKGGWLMNDYISVLIFYLSTTHLF